MTGKPRIFTASYKGFHPAMGVPVRTSIGKPRWPLKYQLDAPARVLFPSYKMLKLPFEEYKELYIAQLERHGTTKIGNVLKSLRTIYGKGSNHLVLLCFEDVIHKGDWCHRRIFANWWDENTGEKVPEFELEPVTGELIMHLNPKGDSPPPTIHQESLL